MTQEELDKIVEQHQHWIKEDCEGCEDMRADLRGANLRGADLSGANQFRLGKVPQKSGGIQMSVLKAHKIGDLCFDFKMGKDVGIDFYLKSEADNVIAELKKACNDKDDWCLHTLKENRHQKYKRCLAMASKCRLRARWFGDNAFYKKEQWALQWHKRWLELAEKFKEAK